MAKSSVPLARSPGLQCILYPLIQIKVSDFHIAWSCSKPYLSTDKGLDQSCSPIFQFGK